MLRNSSLRLAALAALFSSVMAGAAVAADGDFVVEASEVEDIKAVYATVQAADVIAARARISGTVASLEVDEGSEVEGGAVIAVVGDPKLALQIEAVDAAIKALKSEVANAQLDRDRTKQLFDRGTVAKARLDQVETALDVAANNLKAKEAEKSVISQQMSEGQVLAPGRGRVLSVPVTTGSVVMPGETIATIATNSYLLRLELPERHARFVKVGDKVMVGKRGLSRGDGGTTEGELVQVYPELQSGRVVADARVEGLGDYFVGERALVWIAAGKRRTMLVPTEYTFTRYGIDYVRVAHEGGEPTDVVVQLGHPRLGDGAAQIEVLAGIKAGDHLVKP
ncbi:MAG: efflux RND transporter periplasmic adaptor subunit [Hyphomicrobiales bacterium]